MCGCFMSFPSSSSTKHLSIHFYVTPHPFRQPPSYPCIFLYHSTVSIHHCPSVTIWNCYFMLISSLLLLWLFYLMNGVRVSITPQQFPLPDPLLLLAHYLNINFIHSLVQLLLLPFDTLFFPFLFTYLVVAIICFLNE